MSGHLRSPFLAYPVSTLDVNELSIFCLTHLLSISLRHAAPTVFSSCSTRRAASLPVFHPSYLTSAATYARPSPSLSYSRPSRMLAHADTITPGYTISPGRAICGPAGNYTHLHGQATWVLADTVLVISCRRAGGEIERSREDAETGRDMERQERSVSTATMSIQEILAKTCRIPQISAGRAVDIQHRISPRIPRP